jgi:hypothetical protein
MSSIADLTLQNLRLEEDLPGVWIVRIADTEARCLMDAARTLADRPL